MNLYESEPHSVQSRGRVAVFYGKLAMKTRRDAEKTARAAGYRIAASLGENPDVVVLGEGESLAASRTRLAAEFDARSQAAFESGALTIIAESRFWNALGDAPSEASEFASAESARSLGGPPAAAAELAGVSIATIRRFWRRGLIVATPDTVPAPYFSPREISAAKRLAFLCSTGLSEDFVERRLRAFLETARETAPETSLGDVVLSATLTSDGRDLLVLADGAAVDWRGQRRFDFAITPPDGAIPATPPERLSAEEAEIALTEKLAAWSEANARDDSPDRPLSAPPFLAIFGASEPPRMDERGAAPDDEKLSRKVARLCETGWNLETQGFWEEAAKEYRAALALGGADPGLSFRLGKILYLLNDFSAARERFYSTLELDAERFDARLELARTLAALGEFDDAADALRLAIEKRPEDPIARLELGKTFMRLGRREEAREEIRAALERFDDETLAEEVRLFLRVFENSLQ
ncbi:MAG: tetratricopeptide repeat protein [Thermoguttaceae bacterium]|nr:tetratricopeptide repeat protein [Thermoguttaceae bacterium]